MQSSEIVVAFVVALVAIILGYLLFRFFFDPSTLKIKPRYLGSGHRIVQWFRVHGKRIGLVCLVIAAAAVILCTALRFAGPLIKAAGSLFARPSAATETVVQPVTASIEVPVGPAGIIADHRVVDEVRLDRISPAAIEQAKTKLHIFLVHGTHGSQIVYGLKGLAAFKSPLYDGLDIESLEFGDRNEPDLQSWAERARSYLNDPGNRDTNVVVWAWTDELSSASEQVVSDYLQLTSELEAEHPEVRFVYMTGHMDGSGPDGNLHQRNEQIRAYCLQNNKILYDFADIESYDPEGTYYGDKSVNDGCWYDSDGNGSLDRNWAKEWSEANPGRWYECYAAHTFPLNANLKAYAAWWLWVRLAEEKASGASN